MRRMSGRQRDDEATIDLTSMLDVTFIMLVFFVATTTLAPPTSQRVQLPEAQSSEVTSQEIFQVAVLPDGTVLRQNQPVLLVELEEQSRAFANKHALSQALIEADKDVRTEDLVTVMDRLRTSGIVEIGLATRSSS